MVLSLMRKQAKSWLIKFLIFMISIVFIFYFGYSFRARRGIKVATVNGEIISEVEYQKAYRNLVEGLRKQYKNVWSDNLIKVFNLKRRALESLIDQKLISQEARRIGLSVTKREIQEKIMAYPAFQFRGQFDERRYRALLENNRMKPEDFEAGIAQEILREKIAQFLFTFSPVTDKEVLDRYTYYNEKVKISFVNFSPSRFKKSVKVEKVGLLEYFNKHKEAYRIPAKIKLAYIEIDPDSFKDKVKITDKDIEAYYEDNIAMFREKKKVRARHILFKLRPDAPKEKVEEVRKKALAVLEKVRKGEDFAALAKKYSEGPTASKGGDLGYFSAGQMIKPFEDAAFKLKKGEVSDLVRTRFGYHIIKVEDIKEARTKSLDEVRKQIKKALTKTMTMDLAQEKGLSLIDQMPYDVDIEKYASERKVPAKHTPYFAQNEAIPGIGGDQKLRQSLFSLEKGEVSDLIEWKGKFYLFQVADKKPSEIPPLDEVRKKVKADYINYLAAMEAKKAAQEFLEKLKKGGKWSELAEENGLKPKTTKFFSRQEPVPQIGYEPKLIETAFSLGEKKRYPDNVFENDKGAYVIRWEGKKGIDKGKYEKEKETYRESLLNSKRQMVYKDWLRKLKKRAKIEILRPID
ncbi:MAG: SurA N-terminal domain-containing protein [Deltaproteobacteria bacterium]|nr:SurA N-terminal domain-containing protein [Deltaproteobacteria bacterium]MBW1918783.1 SurA N-terminal domain-containing protein [Deltaproteobacteria bacterium]MBW1934792.1 SurA N-terminal domain-containing protein [Deltaproteobacteria bacterium]RLB31794.1 MAG: hypothetical protein DRH11_12780 [Deltaproteobacteria bacterium]